MDFNNSIPWKQKCGGQRGHVEEEEEEEKAKTEVGVKSGSSIRLRGRSKGDRYRVVGAPTRHDMADARQINDLVAITDGPLLTTVLKSPPPSAEESRSLDSRAIAIDFPPDKSTQRENRVVVVAIYHTLTIPSFQGEKIEPNRRRN